MFDQWELEIISTKVNAELLDYLQHKIRGLRMTKDERAHMQRLKKLSDKIAKLQRLAGSTEHDDKDKVA